MNLHVYVPSTRIAVSVPEYHNSQYIDSSISNHVIKLFSDSQPCSSPRQRLHYNIATSSVYSLRGQIY